MPTRNEQIVRRMLEYCDEIAGTLAWFGNDEQLKHLEELGYITRRQRVEDGFKKTTVYQIMSSVAVSYCHTGSDVLPQWQEGTASVADRTRSNEQDPENKIYPLDPPEGDDEEVEYDGVMYDVTCPSCGEEISFDEETLELGSITCPSCGEVLEFDLGEDRE